MSQSNATATNASSGRAAGGRSSNRASERGQVLGDVEELGSFVFKYGTNDQADMFLRTLDKIADYVGVKESKEMRILVKLQQETTFPDPEPPDDKKATRAEVAWYNTEKKLCREKRDKYADHKASVFVILLGQCTHHMKARVVNDSDYPTLEKNFDVVGLINKLREFAFSTGGEHYKFLNLYKAMRQLFSIHMGTKETVPNYHKRFEALFKVTEAQFGLLCPHEMCENQQAATRKTARDQLMAMIFLAGADKIRYGTLLDDLDNAYLAKTDNYPKTLDTALSLLSNYVDRNGATNNNSNRTQLETSFAQTGRRRYNQRDNIVCWNCQQRGHTQAECRNSPVQGQINTQQGEQEQEENTNSGTRRSSGRRTDWSG